MELSFESITKPSGEQYELLLNDSSTVRHMPLHTGYMNAKACEEWAINKSKQWANPQLGPWSIYVDGEFAGWGGMQPEQNGEVDFALVLDKRFWGIAREATPLMIRKFRELGGQGPLVIFLAESRRSVSTMKKLGFEFLGEVVEGCQTFHKFKLDEQAKE